MRAITVSMVLDDPERVSALLEAGLAEHPDALGLLRIKAMLLLGEGNVDESIVAMQKYLTLAPTDPLAWATLARTLAMAGRQTEGDVAIQRALREAPESDLVRDEAVAYYVETGRSALADEIERGWTGQGR